MIQQRNWVLSPSDFAFLWEECKRCFYLKVVSRFYRPRPPMPKIFSSIDAQMSSCVAGRRTETIAAGMQPGTVEFGEQFVESATISLPNHTTTCSIRGKFDSVIKFDDGTYGVIDFKTAERREEHIPLYGRQLHAYAYALENPTPGSFSLKPITTLGLWVFEPAQFRCDQDGTASLHGRLPWIDVPRDDEAFTLFLDDVLRVLEFPRPPGGAPSCEWCVYRDTSRRVGL
ncbi:MAG: PD-(D/E)XK nuclease family protein [Candidatus Eremiobacteraeota bacterium]|nr:PD-(D/E)XK nuclease family protein [Candidatus Eremiobacteraeota bacterium]MBC5827950.1 PD-(D/E)XK nuclease family protein [Candidatus Eremiobacteraeota bacterium]